MARPWASTGRPQTGERHAPDRVDPASPADRSDLAVPSGQDEPANAVGPRAASPPPPMPQAAHLPSAGDVEHADVYREVGELRSRASLDHQMPLPVQQAPAFAVRGEGAVPEGTEPDAPPGRPAPAGGDDPAVPDPIAPGRTGDDQPGDPGRAQFGAEPATSAHADAVPDATGPQRTGPASAGQSEAPARSGAELTHRRAAAPPRGLAARLIGGLAAAGQAAARAADRIVVRARPGDEVADDQLATDQLEADQLEADFEADPATATPPGPTPTGPTPTGPTTSATAGQSAGPYATRSARRAAREAAARARRDPAVGPVPLTWLVGAVGFVVLQIGAWGLMAGRLAPVLALVLVGAGAGTLEVAWRRLTGAGFSPVAAGPLAKVPWLSLLLVVAVLLGWTLSHLVNG